MKKFRSNNIGLNYPTILVFHDYLRKHFQIVLAKNDKYWVVGSGAIYSEVFSAPGDCSLVEYKTLVLAV